MLIVYLSVDDGEVLSVPLGWSSADIVDIVLVLVGHKAWSVYSCAPRGPRCVGLIKNSFSLGFWQENLL